MFFWYQSVILSIRTTLHCQFCLLYNNSSPHLKYKYLQVVPPTETNTDVLHYICSNGQNIVIFILDQTNKIEYLFPKEEIYRVVYNKLSKGTKICSHKIHDFI